MSTIAAPRTTAARTTAVRTTAAHTAAARTVTARPAAPRPALQGGGERRSMRLVHLRRRAVTAGLLVLGLSSVGYGFADAGPSTSGPVRGGAVHVVRSGETLWGIARTVQPHGDVRPLVDRLARQLPGDTLEPGTRLVVG